MFDNSYPMIFLHGLESSSQSSKAILLRNLFPNILTPDFQGSLDARMKKLYPIMGDSKEWVIIGSSFGGLMAALFATQHPDQVRKLILLAPALMLPEFCENLPDPVCIPTILIHGNQDDVVPLEHVRLLAEKSFVNLKHITVDDGHRLKDTINDLDWFSLVE